MRALLIIDLQNDFARPGGALYFEGAETIIPFILGKVLEYKKEGLPIITTQDWHQQDDLEFQRFGKHCVAGSEGAELVKELLVELQDYQEYYSVKKRRFSAFFETNLDELLKELGIQEIDVCGLVTNICVLHTVEELCNRDIVVRVWEKGVKSYDSGEHEWALKHMERILGAQVVKS